MCREEMETHIFCESANRGARTWDQLFLPRPQLHHTYVNALSEVELTFYQIFLPAAIWRKIKGLLKPQIPKILQHRKLG